MSPQTQEAIYELPFEVADASESILDRLPVPSGSLPWKAYGVVYYELRAAFCRLFADDGVIGYRGMMVKIATREDLHDALQGLLILVEENKVMAEADTEELRWDLSMI